MYEVTGELVPLGGNHPKVSCRDPSSDTLTDLGTSGTSTNK